MFSAFFVDSRGVREEKAEKGIVNLHKKQTELSRMS